MKLILLFFSIFSLLLISKSIQAQGFSCHYNWDNKSAFVVDDQPNTKNMPCLFPGTLKFRIVFEDLDNKKAITPKICPIGTATVWDQTPTAEYEIKFKITQVKDYATFNTNLSIIDVNKTIILTPADVIDNARRPSGAKDSAGNDIYMYVNTYEAFVFLNTTSLWSLPANQKDKITIEYTLKDISTLPVGDTGNLTDALITGKKWTISYTDKPCPTKMINLPGNAADKVWYLPNSNKYDYGVGLDLGTGGIADGKADYTGKILSEYLTGPFVGGMFTLNDLEPTWKADPAHLGLNTEQKVADFLFNPPHSQYFHSWNIVVGAKYQDQFDASDEHGAFDDAAAYDAFTAKAIKAGNAGYLVKQDFKCNEIKIGESEIYKRLFQVGAGATYVQYKKNHIF